MHQDGQPLATSRRSTSNSGEESKHAILATSFLKPECGMKINL